MALHIYLYGALITNRLLLFNFLPFITIIIYWVTANLDCEIIPVSQKNHKNIKLFIINYFYTIYKLSDTNTVN